MMVHQTANFILFASICGISSGEPHIGRPHVDKIIETCPKGNDTELNKCFSLIVEELRPYFGEGVPEIGLPPLEPFKMGAFEFSYGNQPLVVKSTFYNISVFHLSEFTVANFKIDTEKKELSVEIEVPFLRLEGNYKLGGNILLYPLDGNGPYWFELRGVHAIGSSKLKIVEKNGKMVFQTDGSVQNMDLKINDIKVQLLKLFNGGEFAGNVVNGVINDNSQRLYQEIKAPISKQIGEVVANIADAIIGNMPFLTEHVKNSKFE